MEEPLLDIYYILMQRDYSKGFFKLHEKKEAILIYGHQKEASTQVRKNENIKNSIEASWDQKIMNGEVWPEMD